MELVTMKLIPRMHEDYDYRFVCSSGLCVCVCVNETSCYMPRLYDETQVLLPY